MARTMAQLLRLYDSSRDHAHWQNHWRQPVSWAGDLWRFVPFDAAGIVSGLSGDETGLTVSVPADGLTVPTCQWAMGQGWLLELTMVQFDDADEVAGEGPPVGHVVIMSYLGEVVGGSATLTALTMQAGSVLAPIGSQVPPRAMTNSLIGKGAIL